jgi:hypothetical protein
MGAPSKCEVDDASNEVVVNDAGRAARPREPGIGRQVAVRVDVDDERGAVVGEAEVEAAVVAQLQRRKRRRRQPLDGGCRVVGQAGAGDRFCAHELG